MKVSWTREPPERFGADLVVLPCRAGGRPLIPERLDRATRGMLVVLARAEKFKGQPGRTLVWSGRVKGKLARVALIGVEGPAPQPHQWRLAVARGVEIAARLRARSVAVYSDAAEAKRLALETEWSAEALLLATYRFDEHRTKPRGAAMPSSGRIGASHDPDDAAGTRDALRRGRSRGEAQLCCRDLVNEPANVLGPEELAARAAAVAADHGLECRVLGPAEIRKKGMNLLLAVAAASAAGPRLVHLVYRPARGAGSRVALVGKGITFDSGGLCLKPGASMGEMKTDMAGAATVLAVMSALPASGIDREVHGILPIAENAVSGAACRPGDVVTGLSGESVEIVNTDAEGRLILADALAYAAELEPDAIVEHSTLTGACLVALGPHRAALLSRDDGLARRYLAAAERAGELFWRLPMAPELERELLSDVADVKNIGGRHGGTITGALFLQRFAGKRPFLHLDIAGPARAEHKSPLCPKGGTGFGVLTCLEFLATI
ncbi:MAG TPA: leucyl aminopeptidase [Polyangia bacterium]|nr:leucyl aminopeptidase [Polyangia bacterium]